MKIYLDTSVYNRPFDDQTQFRIWLETVAFSIILSLIKVGDVELVASSVVAYENSRNPFLERKRWVESCLRLSHHHVVLNTSIRERARELEKQGVKSVDALHVACAETAAVDYFLTCDDKLTNRYKDGKMMVCNPVEFILNITREENHEHHS
jgi:predicted nucleic acid-binding protein